MNLQNVAYFSNQQTESADDFFHAAALSQPGMLLTETNRREVLEFLHLRPAQTIVMEGFINDNGFENSANRGKFYGYRHASGKLEAVALIGHVTLLESRSDDALSAFAAVARLSEVPIKMIFGESRSVSIFWRHFAGETTPRKVCTELFFELSFPFFVRNCRHDVRPARLEELESIAIAHDEVAFMESGISPLAKDPIGFLQRCRRRIKQGRTFVVFENGSLIFKADVVAETSEVVYLEGIYVAPDYRGREIGSNCLSKLSLQLLARGDKICLLSNLEFKGAHRSFVKAGFHHTGEYQTIFV